MKVPKYRRHSARDYAYIGCLPDVFLLLAELRWGVRL